MAARVQPNSTDKPYPMNTHTAPPPEGQPRKQCENKGKMYTCVVCLPRPVSLKKSVCNVFSPRTSTVSLLSLFIVTGARHASTSRVECKEWHLLPCRLRMSVAAAVGAIGGGRHALTVEDVVSDPITALANLHWAPVSAKRLGGHEAHSTFWGAIPTISPQYLLQFAE